ncbi:hypothetical protein EMPS_03800 [Entomortierella parvispora]|uniref:ERAP1-like C-terminal domain-containing protein n=1 Tax=Entomortierella parvispora TaxID=205924 RepID=A0A9P3H7I6_9FUNG|nr:hypothetical protein EMPS_03800 [Entomortierella parvispora]
MSPERVVLPTNVSPVHYDLKLTPNLETFVLKGEAAITLTFEAPQTKDGEPSFFLVNKSFTGVFRTNCSGESIRKIGQAILAGHPDLAVSDRAGLLADQSSLAVSGYSSVNRLLDLVQYYKNETTFVVWSLLLAKLDNIMQLFSVNDRTYEGVKHFQRELVDKLVHQLGWEFPENEDYLTTRLRGSILSAAGKAGHEATVKEGLRRFELFMQEGADQVAALHPSIRRTAFEIALTHGGVKEFDQVLNYYRTTPKQDQQSMALVALGASAHGQEMIQRVFEFALSSEVRSQDMPHVLSGLSTNIKARHSAWNWIKSHWATLHERFTGNMGMLGLLVKAPVNGMADKAILKDLTDFFADKDVKEFDRDLEQAKEALRIRCKWVSRDGPALEAWLVENGH